MPLDLDGSNDSKEGQNVVSSDLCSHCLDVGDCRCHPLGDQEHHRELKSGHRIRTDSDRHDLDSIEIALKEIKELLSISCPRCGDEPEPGVCSTVAEQRVWLEEHLAEHKNGKLERRTLDDIVAERHEEQGRKHKEFEASHNHLFAPEEEKNEVGVTEKTREETN